jgi:glycosyltransferase involved in cell wall biosynthesis
VKESFIKNGISEKKIYIIPYGTDTSFFTCRSEKPKKFKVLFVGRVGLAKGIHYLLEAWNQLNFSIHDAELHIVGPIDEQVKIYLKQKTLPANIFWHGGLAQEALKKIYASASLFVLPSLQEGLAMVLLEAMASGVPILATTRTGAQDVIINNQEGFIVEPKNATALAEKILWGFKHQDELFNMGQCAAEKAKKQSWTTYVEQVITAYKEIISLYMYENRLKKELWKNV